MSEFRPKVMKKLKSYPDLWLQCYCVHLTSSREKMLSWAHIDHIKYLLMFVGLLPFALFLALLATSQIQNSDSPAQPHPVRRKHINSIIMPLSLKTSSVYQTYFSFLNTVIVLSTLLFLLLFCLYCFLVSF